MQKKPTSWGTIALWLILFFPVGIFFIVKKMTDENFNYIKNGKSLRIVGYILLGFAAIYLIMGLTGELKTEDGSNVIGPIVLMLIIFGGGGALCIFKGANYIKRGTKYNRYVSIINASNDLLVDNIAAAVPTTYDKAVSDIQSMLDVGFFMNAYLDLNKRELIMPKSAAKPSAAINNTYTGFADVTNSQPHSLKCPNCGATNTVIPGAKNECEYCGSLL